ncbi:MAG TPA: EI24 domain-containing protein, partial [Acetobacteraceae bacterium]|nr:EI24 domain-containing protein [Acetobacteraceae bacterium]
MPGAQSGRPRTLFTPLLRAIGQLDDPALLWVLLESVLLSALCFGGLVFGAIWLVHHLVAHGSLGWFAGALGGLLGVLAAVWLFVPIALVIAGLFLEPVCRAVERRWYPELPPPQPASLIAQSGDLLVLGLQVLLLSVVAFFLSLIFPGVGHILGWLVTAWAFGRGLFAAVAMRRMIRRQALGRYSANRAPVLL